MEQYNVTGMSCAACQTRVEKAVQEVEGVTSCAVSLLTNSMGVEGSASPTEIIKAVEKAGYGASLKRKDMNSVGNSIERANADSLIDKETPILRKRLISSVIFVVVLMYFSMGHMMLGWPLPHFFDGNHVAMGLVQMLLTICVMIINKKFFVNGFRGLIHRSPNMDTLVALGSGVSFLWSTFILFLMTRAQVDGNVEAVNQYMMEFYFESAAMILALITVGKMLESRSKGKTTDALKSLLKLAPKNATVIVDGEEKQVDIEEVNVGDIFVVRPGESVPVDGEIIDGESAINESALTGESIPVDKKPGDKISAATINQSGFIKCKALRVGEDTTLSQIIQMVSDAAATKAPIAKIADRVSGVFVPVVICIAVLTCAVWLLCGGTLGYSLARGISVLVISCPCALGLATPVAIMVGNGVGAKNGILFKTSSALEMAGKANIVVLDKTGTITKGEPVVVEVIPEASNSERELLEIAYSLELGSEHPLARAIVQKATDMDISVDAADEFKALSGHGVTGVINGVRYYGGNMAFISNKVELPNSIKETVAAASENGYTPLLFASDEKYLGMIAVADEIKEDSAKAISELRNLGVHTVMLTGDNPKTAGAIGKLSGVDEVVAGVLPDGKEQAVKQLMDYGKVIMVGDGINDAPALTRSDVGMAIGAGTDVAIDAADVVLMHNSIMDVAAAIRLSRKTLKNIHENLFWAFIYNIIGIPLAAGCFIKIFGWSLNPMFGAAAMSLSSFCVVSNALRLNLIKIYDSKKDKKINNIITENIVSGYKPEKGEKNMSQVVLNVEGMMCPHCEASVKKAIEAMASGVEAVADHNANTVTITGGQDITDADYKKVIEENGYVFKGIAR